MTKYQAGERELEFANLIWDHEPVASGELTNLAAKELGWAKSTMYTVLKRLTDRGLFTNERGMVRALVTREEFASGQSRQFVERNFGGSLPGFLAAFSDGRKLSAEDVAALEALIEESRHE